jgi:hypothetical protein
MSNAGFVDLSKFGAELMLAEKLFALGARTHMVCHLCAISPLLQTSCRLKFLKKIKFEIKDEIIYKVFCRLQRASSNKSL